MDLPARVEVVEVGPRDGLQNEKNVPTGDKVALIEALDGFVPIAARGREDGMDLEALMDAAGLLERLVDHPLNTWIKRTLPADPGAAR